MKKMAAESRTKSIIIVINNVAFARCVYWVTYCEIAFDENFSKLNEKNNV